MAKKSNNAILAFIAIVLVGILGLLVYTNFIEKSPEEKMADSITETIEDIGNAVADETKGQ